MKMPKWAKELKEDFHGALDEVRNPWVRRSVCVALGLVLVVFDTIGGAILGACEMLTATWFTFTLPTWKGPKK